MAGVIVQIIDEEEGEGAVTNANCEATHGYVGGQWVTQPAQKLRFAQWSMVRKEKPF